MEEILHHLGCIKPFKKRAKLPINWCRISSINSRVGREEIEISAWVNDHSSFCDQATKNSVHGGLGNSTRNDKKLIDKKLISLVAHGSFHTENCITRPSDLFVDLFHFFCYIDWNTLGGRSLRMNHSLFFASFPWGWQIACVLGVLGGFILGIGITVSTLTHCKNVQKIILYTVYTYNII